MRKFASIAALALAGCATSGAQLQSECEARHPAFPEAFECTKAAVYARRADALSDPRVKLYLLKGEQLAGQVRDAQIKDIDARVEWQRLFVELKAANDAEVSRILATIPKPVPARVCTSTRSPTGTVTTRCD